jgi:hypothetical protein
VLELEDREQMAAAYREQARANPNAAALKDYPTTTLLAGPVLDKEWPESV